MSIAPSMPAAAQSAPPYAKGFETLEEEIDDRLPRRSRANCRPGSKARCCARGRPSFEVGEHPYRHWFDGLTMLHRFSFGDGAVSYGNRFLRGKTWAKAERTGEIPYGEFATDPCRSLFKRVQTTVLAGVRRQRQHQRRSVSASVTCR